MTDKELFAGVPSQGVPEFVTALHAEHAGSPLQLVLPGCAFTAEDAIVTALIPAAVVTLPDAGTAAAHAVIVQFAVVPHELGESAPELACESLTGESALRYELVVDGGELTVGELIRAAHEGGLDVGSPACVYMMERFTLEAKAAPVQSRRMRALVTAKTWDPYPGAQPRDDLPFLFDCHSHWYSQRRTGKPTRYWTVCHGTCNAGRCTCSIGGRTGGACTGWRFCWC